MSKKYLVYVESIGDPLTEEGYIAHVPALPGASACGKTLEEAQANIRQAVVDYLTLLRDVGEQVPRAGEGLDFDFEEVDSATFPTDYDAIHPNEMEVLFRWMAVSRQELVDLLKSLSAEDLEWQPNPEAASIKDILYRIAEADLWYTDRLERWPEAPLFRLAAARGVALERLRATTEAVQANMVTYQGEDWTARKIIRRMLEHEREHIRQIKDRLEARAQTD